MNPYAVLEISPEASKEDIKKAFKKLALKFHPDRNQGDKAAEDKFKEINEAYQMLTDDNYQIPGNQPQDFSNVWQNIGFNPLSHFEDIFKNAEFSRPRRTTYRLNTAISFKEACQGVEKTFKLKTKSPCNPCQGQGALAEDLITCESCKGLGTITTKHQNMVFSKTCHKCKGTGAKIAKPCTSCSGKGFVEGISDHTVFIPSCIDNGNTCSVNLTATEALLLTVSVIPDPQLTRIGTDIHSTQKVSLKDVLLGCKLNINTLVGEKTITLKSCVNPNFKIRLRDCGAVDPRSKILGNHILTLEVQYPEELTDEQKEKLKEVLT